MEHKPINVIQAIEAKKRREEFLEQLEKFKQDPKYSAIKCEEVMDILDKVAEKSRKEIEEIHMMKIKTSQTC